jgi:hypothetical protein
MSDFQWPKRPYKGLRKYSTSTGDAALFVGRKTEIDECGERLRNNSTSVFILHGLSGTGKSSFLRAGLVHYLRNLDKSRLLLPKEREHNYETTMVVRSGNAPLRELAGRIWDLTELILQEPSVLSKTREMALRARRGKVKKERFIAQASSHEEFLRALDALSRATPYQMVLIVDQVDEIFPPRRQLGSGSKEFLDFIRLLCRYRPDVKLLIGMRSDCKPKFDEELSARSLTSSTIDSYYLSPISEAGLIDAILRPTQKDQIDFYGRTLPPPNYNFEFEKDLPQQIQKDLDQIAPSLRLPVIQVICDRLYSKLPKGRRIITFKDYRATGACNAQVASHIDEKIVQYFLSNYPEGKIALGKEADRWKRLLSRCAERHSDGRVSAGPAIPHSKLVKMAKKAGCLDPEAMVRQLATEEDYILEKVTPIFPHQEHRCRLLHDSVAAALIHWCDSEGAHRERPMASRDPLLATDDRNYLTPFHGSPITFSTINDLIWDHQIALYAESKGFSQRLGLRFDVMPSFDLTKSVSKTIDYLTFVSRKRTKSYRLIVMPPFLLDDIKRAPWISVGICNIYRGYAIIGQQHKDLEPVRSLHDDNSESNRRLHTHRLERLACVLADSATKIGVYEEGGLRFVKLVLDMNGLKPKGDIKMLGVNKEGKAINSTQDLLFSALVSEDIHFALGPAPSRALAEQAGLIVYADFEDVEFLSTNRQREELQKLLMYTTWAVDVPRSDEATLLRLAAVLFYTVDYVRRNPEDFITFLHDQMLLALNDGGYWLQRRFIRAAVESCYSYTASSDYVFEFVCRQQLAAMSASWLYAKWVQLRGRCDDLIVQLSSMKSGTWPTNARDAFDRGQRQYRIYNYYDAFRELQTVLKRLGIA